MQQTARPFRVGQRVRIRLSAECRVRWVADREIPLRDGHPASFDGATGAVVHVQPDDGTGHTVHVQFDTPIRKERQTSRSHVLVWEGGSFSPEELEPSAAHAGLRA